MGSQVREQGITYTIRAEEAASLLGVSKWTVYRWIKAGVLPARKLGGLWLVPRHELTLAVRTRPLPGAVAEERESDAHGH